MTIFTTFLLLLVSTSFLGGSVGFGLGCLISRSSWLRDIGTRFLVDALWFPFFVIWALPWPSAKGSFLWALEIGVLAVALSTCYTYLAIHSILISVKEARLHVLRQSILQALLFSLMVAPIWVPGWTFIVLKRPEDMRVVYFIMVFVITLLFTIDISMKYSFDGGAKRLAAIFSRGLSGESATVFQSRSIAMIILTCVFLWQLLALASPFIISPLDIAVTLYHLLFTGMTIVNPGETIWAHIGVSLAEILGGLILGAGLAFIALKGLAKPVSRSLICSILPVTHLTPIVLPFFWYLLPNVKS